MTGLAGTGLDVFATCPQSKGVEGRAYAKSVRDVARWSEAAGCRGILVYSDNGLVDPWLVSDLILRSTDELCPLVAVQPLYLHPYAAATMISTLAFVHDRRIFLNMLAGGFKNDLVALGDATPHDDRYKRTVEYTQIVTGLLRGEAVSYQGTYYGTDGLRLSPQLDPELFPGLLISGSSEAGLAAARAIGATAVKYPKPPAEEKVQADVVPSGLRVGIIAREDGAEAWRVANERFPEDRRGQIAHQMAMRTSDSHWHRQLSELGERPMGEEDPYWLRPFQNYSTFCPYLVGSYDRVAEELARYMALNFTSFILDIPPSEEELHHTGVVFDRALAQARA
jgi:alkanesulfonate monooxygenase